MSPLQHASNEMSNRRLRHLEDSSFNLSKKLTEAEAKLKRYNRGVLRLQSHAESLVARIEG